MSSRRVLQLVSVLLLLLLLAACATPATPGPPQNPPPPEENPPPDPDPDPDPNPDPGPVAGSLELSGTLFDWNAVIAPLDAGLSAAAGNTEIATGSLAADGSIALTLLGPLPETALNSLPNTSELCSAAPLNPAARLQRVSAFRVIVDGNAVADLGLVSHPAVMNRGLTQQGEYYLEFVYSDRDASASGECAVGGGNPTTFRYALELSLGWNAVVVTLLDDGASELIELRSAPLPADAVWALRSATP